MEADLKPALERLTRDVERLESSASYCAHFGTPRFKDQTRWNDQFAADLRLLLAAWNARAGRMDREEVARAARELDPELWDESLSRPDDFEDAEEWRAGRIEALGRAIALLEGDSSSGRQSDYSPSRDSLGPAADALDPVAGEAVAWQVRWRYRPATMEVSGGETLCASAEDAQTVAASKSARPHVIAVQIVPLYAALSSGSPPLIPREAKGGSSCTDLGGEEPDGSVAADELRKSEDAALALRLESVGGANMRVRSGEDRATIKEAVARLREMAAPALTADFVRALPGGKLDDSEYEQIESALDRADAPCQAADGSWLTLPERVGALRDHCAETVRLLLDDCREYKRERDDAILVLASPLPRNWESLPALDGEGVS